MQDEITRINEGIKEGLQNWGDIMLTADADNWSSSLNYDNTDVMNAVLIFQHVLSNVGIKRGVICNGEKSTELGTKLRHLVKEMTGLDTHEIVKEKIGK